MQHFQSYQFQSGNNAKPARKPSKSKHLLFKTTHESFERLQRQVVATKAQEQTKCIVLIKLYNAQF